MTQSMPTKEAALDLAQSMKQKGYAKVQVRKSRYGNWGVVWSPRLSRRSNPTKVQKREKVRKASVQRRVASALAKFLHQANPAMKTAGATVTRLKGGGFTIRPIKAVKRGRR